MLEMFASTTAMPALTRALAGSPDAGESEATVPVLIHGHCIDFY